MTQGHTDPFSSKNELCAGMKFKFPEFEIYNRSYEGKDSNGKNKYSYKLVDTKTDTVRVLQFRTGFPKPSNIFSPAYF